MPRRRDSWLRRARWRLQDAAAALADRFRRPPADATGIAGECLMCQGTGTWYEGTRWEEPCVNCGGTGCGEAGQG